MLQGNNVSSKLLLLALYIIITNASLLSAPWNVTMESVNMRHHLRWSPPKASSCSALFYSVQFQGEWELLYNNGSWEEAFECQRILHPECDLTYDLASDSDYNIRVRAECDSQGSEWTALNTTFNRRNTIIAIVMDVKVFGDAVHVHVGPQSPVMKVTVTMWEEGEDPNTTGEVVDIQHLTHTFLGLRHGATYCLRAQAAVEGSHQSSSTAIQCVPIPSAQRPLSVPVVVCGALVGTMALACLLGWATKHRKQMVQSLSLHREPLPSVLVDNWQMSTLILEEPQETWGISLLLQSPQSQSYQEML